jgi:hypothetical protein
MKVTGHKTESIFERYNITDSKDIQSAGQAVTKYLKEQQAAAKVAKPETKMMVVA